MNLLDAVVTKVYGKPVKLYDRWWLPVEYSCWGYTSTTKLMFETYAEAEEVKPGYRFVT